MRIKLVAAVFLLVTLISSLVQAATVYAADIPTVYIRADGSIEGTTNIQGAGEYYRFMSNVSGRIVIEKEGITLDGQGYALDGTRPTNRPGGNGITLSGKSNVTLKNMYITRYDVCIFLSQSSNNKISGNTLISTDWWPGSTSLLQLWENSNSNEVSENTIIHERDGQHFESIDVRRSFNNTINGNNVTSNGGCLTIDEYASNTNISENIFSAKTNVGIEMIYTPAYPGGVNLWGSNTTFTNNTLSGAGLLIHNNAGNIIYGNTVNGGQTVFLDNAENIIINSGGQVVLTNCRNITIRNLGSFALPVNIQLLATVNTEVFNCSGSVVISGGSSGNKVEDSSCPTIKLQNSDGNTITGNIAAEVILDASDANEICGNNITRGSAGIQLTSSANNRIHGNNIANSGDGIVLQTGTSPPYDGTLCSGNRIYENNIANNSNSGIFVSYSSSNTIYRNNFVNNKVHVMGWDSADRWDNGSMGNFWSGYQGVDANLNGVGDTRYVISLSSHLPPGSYLAYDNYPLMSPANVFSPPELSPEPSSPGPVIPEFPALTVLPLALVAVAVAVLAYLKRRRKS